MLKVLIVDNEAVIRHGLMHCIDWNALGCEVAAEVRDGTEAFECIPDVQPDIIISDIRMPGMDGMQLAERVSVTYPNIKIIILTGFPDFEYAQKAIQYHVVDFVLKPTSIEQLTNAVRKAIQMIHQEEQQRELYRTIQAQSEQNLQLEQSILLRDLIQNEHLSEAFISKRTAQSGLDLQQYYILLFHVEPDQDADPDFSSCLDEARKILGKCLAACKLYSVPAGEKSCYIVVNVPDDWSIIGACKETAAIVRNLTRAILSIGISLLHNGPFEVHQAAREAKSAQKFAEYNTDLQVTSYEDLPQTGAETLEHITQDLKLLKAAIENQNLSVSQSLLHSLFQYIRQCRLPFNEIRGICIYIYNFCIGPLFLHKAESCVASLVSIEDILDGQNIDGIESRLSEFLDSCLELANCNPEKLDHLVLTIKNYIDEHYADNISLEMLAGVVHLSPSYLSKLFKKELGENISTYLQNVRIEKAKMLLQNTSMKSYEVAEAVGISNPIYFSRIFKRATGIKPKDYKNAISHKNAASDSPSTPDEP